MGVTVELLAEAGYSWGFKQVTNRKLNAKSRVNAADEPGSQERVSTELKEVVVNADSGHPQSLGKDYAEDLFLRRAGSARGVGRDGQIRRGQPFTIQLAVGRERQGIKQHDCARHHIIGQSAAQ